MQKFIDVTALGELLIDFTSGAVSAQGNPLYEANPGGAPCNLLSMVCRLGKKTAFIGKVGRDVFGSQLRTTIEHLGIDSRGLKTDPEVHTTLAIVHTAPDGDRSFSFYRNPGADMMLTTADLDRDLLTGCRIFHFGSLSMTHPGVAAATKTAVAVAKQAGALISFDPNLRPPLWDALDDAREQILYGCSQADILKIAAEELAFISRLSEMDNGVCWLRQRYPQLRVITVTCGKHGSVAFANGLRVQRESCLEVRTVDTTGAGDCFAGCCLGYLLDHEIDSLTASQLGEMLEFGNAAASLVTTQKGALCVMPTPEEVWRLVRAHFG